MGRRRINRCTEVYQILDYSNFELEGGPVPVVTHISNYEQALELQNREEYLDDDRMNPQIPMEPVKIDVYNTIIAWESDQMADRRKEILARLTDEEKRILGLPVG